MPDIVIRHIDEQMADRIKTLARERRWSINDVILHALRHGLGLAPVNLFPDHLLDSGELSPFAGHWDAEEKAAFQEALQALARPVEAAAPADPPGRPPTG